MFRDTATILVVGLCVLPFQIPPTTSQAISQEHNLHCLKIVSNITLKCGSNHLRFGTNKFSWEKQCLNRTSPQLEHYTAMSCTESLNLSCVCSKIPPLECITVYRCLSNQPTNVQHVEFVLRSHASCNSSQPDVQDQYTRIGCGENSKSQYWTSNDGVNHVALKNSTDYDESVNKQLDARSNQTFTCFSLDTELYYVSELCSIVVGKPPVSVPQEAEEGLWKIVAIVMIVFAVFSFLANICLCCKNRLQRNDSANNTAAPVAGTVRMGTENNEQSASDSQRNGESCGYICLGDKKKQEKASEGYTALRKHNALAVTRTMLESSRGNFASTSADYRNPVSNTTPVTKNVESTAAATPQRRPEPRRGNGRPGRQSGMESSGTYEDIENDPSPASRPATYLDIEESDEFSYDYTDDQTACHDGSLAHLCDSAEYVNDSICRKVC